MAKIRVGSNRGRPGALERAGKALSSNLPLKNFHEAQALISVVDSSVKDPLGLWVKKSSFEKYEYMP